MLTSAALLRAAYDRAAGEQVAQVEGSARHFDLRGTTNYHLQRLPGAMDRSEIAAAPVGVGGTLGRALSHSRA
jgi:hypothetical protein